MSEKFDPWVRAPIFNGVFSHLPPQCFCGFSPGTLPDTVMTKTSILSTGASEAVDGYCSLRGPVIPQEHTFNLFFSEIVVGTAWERY